MFVWLLQMLMLGVLVRKSALYLLQAADLDGEINLSTCYDVTDFPVQRNYGFQIYVSIAHTCVAC